ncbi:hypothetical protein ACTFIW_011061 [Dictyostelium discoideum]
MKTQVTDFLDNINSTLDVKSISMALLYPNSIELSHHKVTMSAISFTQCHQVQLLCHLPKYNLDKGDASTTTHTESSFPLQLLMLHHQPPLIHQLLVLHHHFHFLFHQLLEANQVLVVVVVVVKLKLQVHTLYQLRSIKSNKNIKINSCTNSIESSSHHKVLLAPFSKIDGEPMTLCTLNSVGYYVNDLLYSVSSPPSTIMPLTKGTTFTASSTSTVPSATHAAPSITGRN